MEPHLLVSHLEALLTRLGVPVRYERFDERLFRGLSPRGGLCRINDQRQVVVNDELDTPDKAIALLTATSSLGLDLDTVFIPPAVRRELARFDRSHPPSTAATTTKTRAHLRLVSTNSSPRRR